jgi:hypothetical protein
MRLPDAGCANNVTELIVYACLRRVCVLPQYTRIHTFHELLPRLENKFTKLTAHEHKVKL